MTAEVNARAIAAAEPLVVVRVEDAINAILAGHEGANYPSPPQPSDQALVLVW
ncbi:MAG: hypothetical protein QOF54_277, partial [Solirubrobacteraceae bacterium]|nr:hypothetical protein [Solirubrobacteraceae bacterium]